MDEFQWAKARLGRCGAALVAIAALLACSPDSDGSASTTVSSPGGAAEADVLVVYVVDGGSGSGGMDRLLVERPLGARPVEVGVPEVRDIGYPDVSSDGQHVVYAAFGDQAETGQIWISSLDDEDDEPRPITEGAEGWWCPRWMPDDRHVIAFRDVPEDQLVVLDTESGDADVVETDIAVNEMGNCVDASPDGQDLATARNTAEVVRNEVWSIPIDGGTGRLLGTIPDDCIINHVSWSPRGTAIAADAICERTEFNGIWLVGTSGAAPIQLAGDNPAGGPAVGSIQYWNPAWDPSGEQVFFHRNVTTRQGQEPEPPSTWVVDTKDGRVRQAGPPATFMPAAGPA